MKIHKFEKIKEIDFKQMLIDKCQEIINQPTPTEKPITLPKINKVEQHQPCKGARAILKTIKAKKDINLQVKISNALDVVIRFETVDS